MALSVPDDVRRETTKCPHDFACLSTGSFGDPGKCAVRDADGKNVLFLTSEEQLSCPYRIPFGRGQLCTCPTHYAAYLQQRRDRQDR